MTEENTFAPYPTSAEDARHTPLLGEEKERIHDALLSYLRATQKSDGDEAQKYLSSDGQNHFAAIAGMVQTADQAELMEIGSSDRMTILMVRSEIPRDVIRFTKPADFFSRVVSAGLLKRDAMDAIQLSTITGSGKEARVALTAGGAPVPVFFSMIHEPNGWKVNYRQIRDLGDKLLAQLAKQRELRLIDVEMQAIQNALGHPLDPKWWKPLVN